jgi:hypothetical protein
MKILKYTQDGAAEMIFVPGSFFFTVAVIQHVNRAS